MNRATLASIAAGLMISAAPAMAQMQEPQKGPSGGASPQMQGAPSGQREPGMSGSDADKAAPKAKAEPRAKAGKDSAQGKEPTGKGTAQTEPKGKTTQGTANQATEPKGTEPKGKASKGTTEKAAEPKEKATKGTAEKAAEPKEKATKGSAEKAPEPQDKAIKGTAEKGSAGRVQVSEQQRSNIGQTLVKEKSVNRVTNVNFSISIGTRAPRSVRFSPLPASVIAIVPAYRSYHYFVVGDQLCIVDPASYEIVEVIVITDQTAMRSERGPAALVLTESERALIVREIEVGGSGSTLALGSLTEGADVPRDVEVRVFSDAVVEKVPKLRGYKFFAAENRIAIVDPQGAKVQLVIEHRR